jgi:hypothetical protein
MPFRRSKGAYGGLNRPPLPPCDPLTPGSAWMKFYQKQKPLGLHPVPLHFNAMDAKMLRPQCRLAVRLKPGILI